jgi:alkanesulfonate monooxygenase SsuD/methylene tetrahydromethanopterin reductase-like flavin-dependent oxidoreductase (luciferase family)
VHEAGLLHKTRVLAVDGDMPLELGLYTFGDLVADPHTGKHVSPEERMHQMLRMAQLADDAGLDIFGVGEHHGLSYVNSATATMVAAMAAVTKRIRLTSASTSISTADPVRTFAEFATADLVSRGRVELVFGRGAFTDNFPLFGFSLDDYDALFVEKVALFAELNAHPRVSWTGRFRAPLRDAEIAPRPSQSRLPVWIGSGSPMGVVRAATLGYPLAMPMVGGSLQGYAKIVSLYRDAWKEHGHAPEELRLAVYSHLHLTESPQQLVDFYPYYSGYLRPLFKGPMPSSVYAQMISPAGALIAGTPDAVIEKILAQREVLGTTRYVGQIDIGGQPFDAVMKGIERFAAYVAPAVRKATA